METVIMNKMNVEDELFCVRFELETLSNKVNFSKSERWVKGFVGESTELAHIDRYQFITGFTENKSVLDIACGSGYGTYMISNLGKAASVFGVDLDESAVQYGNLKYPANNIKRVVADATEFSSVEKFDVIICFETIEHIPNYLKLVENLWHNLKSDGIIFISTPITQLTTQKPLNPYHVIEWNFFDFHKLFDRKLELAEIFIQNVQIRVNRTQFSFFKKVINKVFNIKSKTADKIEKKGIHSYVENEFDMNRCFSGYQILKLKKIKE